MNKCLVTDEDPQGRNISLQFTPCYVIAQQRHHSMNKTLASIGIWWCDLNEWNGQ